MTVCIQLPMLDSSAPRYTRRNVGYAKRCPGAAASDGLVAVDDRGPQPAVRPRTRSPPPWPGRPDPGRPGSRVAGPPIVAGRLDAHSDAQATGTVSFPVCYEGPPGYVHGGFLGVFFDCVVQHHNCLRGLTGRTRGLELRYRRPVPLEQELTFVIDRAVDSKNVSSVARLLSGDEALCTATTSAVASDHAALPAVSPRRGDS